MIDSKFLDACNLGSHFGDYHQVLAAKASTMQDRECEGTEATPNRPQTKAEDRGR
jgi:hypothetical protein